MIKINLINCAELKQLEKPVISEEDIEYIFSESGHLIEQNNEDFITKKESRKKDIVEYHNSLEPTVEFYSIDMVKDLSKHNDSSIKKKQYITENGVEIITKDKIKIRFEQSNNKSQQTYLVEYLANNIKLSEDNFFKHIYSEDNEKFLNKLYSGEEIYFDGNKVNEVKSQVVRDFIEYIKIYTTS